MNNKGPSAVNLGQLEREPLSQQHASLYFLECENAKKVKKGTPCGYYTQ